MFHPIHVVYGGAQLFRADTAERLGVVARAALETYAPWPASLAAAVGWSSDDPLADLVHTRVRERLATRPVEDYRIDFEDGYGFRPDAEEDALARAVGEALAAGMAASSLPPRIGVRVKPMHHELRARSERTLALVLESLLERAGRLPDGFTVTLPKISDLREVAAFTDYLAELEQRLSLGTGTLSFEIMVETPQLVMDATGRCPLADAIAAGGGRITAAHFGPYDYTGALGVTAVHQRLRHPACDFARHTMQVALAGTGVRLSDGPTAVLPVAIHRGETPSPAQLAENRATVHRAWRLHYEDVMHAMAAGFYQGWDLHPAQLVSRYAAVYAFFLGGIGAAGGRLRNFVEQAARATMVGNVFDDAATGQGLLNFFLQALSCGAVTEEEALARTGLTLEELRGRSFAEIARRRVGN